MSDAGETSHKVVSGLSPAMINRWQSEERFATYLNHAGGDQRTALDLYLWNSRLSAAILRDFGYIEVLVRHAYDREISKSYPDWGCNEPSLFNLEEGVPRARAKQRELNEQSRKALVTAHSSLRKRDVPISHGRVVAELSLGFWGHLTEGARTSTIWTPLLSNAFQERPARGSVHNAMHQVRKIRNRAAHLEPLFGNPEALKIQLTAGLQITSALSAQVLSWLRHHSDVPSLLESIPIDVPPIKRSGHTYRESSFHRL